MPDCPNCGRLTMRTKDWVCQYCGYPLLSKAYKALDKTYKELQEEEKAKWKFVVPEPTGYDLQEEVTASETRTTPAAETVPAPEPEAAVTPQQPPSPETEPEPEPEPEPMITPPPDSYPEPSHELEPGPTPQEAPIVEEPKPQPIITPPPASVAPPAPEPGTGQQPGPEVAPEAPADAPAPPLEDIGNGTRLTVDQLNELFSGDRKAAGAALQGKSIIVRGQVSKVFVRDHIDVRYIILESLTKKGSWSVRCVFDKSAVPQLIRLNEGNEVTVRGYYDGFSKNVILKDCELV